MSGKRVSLASLATGKVEAVPGAGRPDLVHVHPDTVAPTPLNPRRNFNESELAELGEDMRSGQLQPCVAVARSSYLKLYPEHAGQLDDRVRYVMAAGERRWRAAVKAGLDTLDVLIRHDLTESRIRFLAAVLSENVQRANFNPIEEANGLRAMLDLHDGNQSAAAQAMGKSKQWFNQRIGLLRLTDDMVQLVLEGKLTAFRDMRRYAAMPAAEQYPAWKADQEQPRPPRQPEPVVRDVAEPQTYTAVYANGDRPAQGEPPREQAAPGPERRSGPAEQHGVVAPATVPPTPETIPEPREAQPEHPVSAPPAPGLKRFPYHDGIEAGGYLISRMSDAEFLQMMPALLERYRKLVGDRS
jgi:ParB family transcriptional regulator, chromosome partitioning protein